MKEVDLLLYFYCSIFYLGQWQLVWFFLELSGHSSRGPIISIIVYDSHGGIE